MTVLGVLSVLATVYDQCVYVRVRSSRNYTFWIGVLLDGLINCIFIIVLGYYQESPISGGQK